MFVCSPFTFLISLLNFCPCSSTVIFIMNLLVPVYSPFINLRSLSIPPHVFLMSFWLALNLPSFEFIHNVISRRRRSVTENENYKSEINVFRSNIQTDSVTRWIFFEGLNILICTFCVCADGFQCPSKAFHCPKQLLTFDLLL